MKVIKKNQIIVYVLVLILMVAGYLNYSNNTENEKTLETTAKIEANDDTELADIGDAVLVNSNNVQEENTTQENISENNIEKENSMNTKANTDINTYGINSINTSNTTNTTETNVVETSSTSSNDYFVKSKLERDTMYSQMIESYENVLNSTNALETQKQSATEEIQKINNDKNSIMICENLIQTKGFENSVIFVNGESINAIIGAEQLKQEEIAQIQNIISREMNAKIENIHITNK